MRATGAGRGGEREGERVRTSQSAAEGAERGRVGEGARRGAGRRGRERHRGARTHSCVTTAGDHARGTMRVWRGALSIITERQMNSKKFCGETLETPPKMATMAT